MCSSSWPTSLSSSSSLSPTTGYGLIVEGIPLGSGGQFTPRLTMKRVYDTKCFRPERYRHEVANHYRDYKLQQHLHQHHQHHQHQQQRHRGQRRRRRRHYFGGAAAEASRVSASLASQYAQFRDVWPTHCHYFPRSDDTSEPPDAATYNDAVRRIRSAHSCEQLRQLVQRQLERHRLPWWRSCNNDELVAPELAGSQSSVVYGRVDYKLNIHKRSAAESPQLRLPEREEQVQVDLYAYLQLASGYYERGLQADLKYLQSIGQQQRQKQVKQQQPQQRRCNAIKPLEEDVSSISQRSESPVQRRLVTLLKSLRRKAASQKRAGHPEIRVNIRSVKREQEQQQEEQETDVEEELEQEEEQEEPEEEDQEQPSSMCDYYAPAAAATTTEAAGSSLEATTRASVASVATAAHQRRLYEIIDNLSHLSIAGDTTTAGISGGGGGGGGGTGSRRQHLQLTLPQITLTDCSTTAQQVALYSSNSIVTIVQTMPKTNNNHNNEARAKPSLDLRAT